jgi:cyanophycin synthetase
MHLKPAEGTPRPVGRAIIEHLFPEGRDCRIPIVGITGTNHTTAIARLVAWMLHLSGRHVGLACASGLYLNRRQVEKGNGATWETGQRVLVNRAVEAAVFENGPKTILSEGLAYDRCQVGVVTDVGGADQLGDHDIHEAAQVFNVLRTQVDVVLPDGAAVLNAHDPLVVDMAPLCAGEVIYYGLAPTLPVIAAHLASGGRAVFVRDGQVTLGIGTESTSVASLAAPSRRRNGRSRPPAECVLAAVGAAAALYLSHDTILTGIETFDLNGAGAPRSNGRQSRTAVH